MPITKRADFNFEPQIAQSTIMGYFRQELIWGSMGWRAQKDFANTPGGTLTFPYFDTIGDAEEPGEDTALAVDNLGDNSFTAVIKEVGKAVGITDKARVSMGLSGSEWGNEAYRQIGRVMAEKLDKDILTEISLAANHDSVRSVSNVVLSAIFGADKGANSIQYANELFNIRSFSSVLTDGFGDKRREAAAVVLHSQHYNSMETDLTSGFLKADANDPLYKVAGFIGRSSMFFGLPLFINDNVPAGANVTITDSAGTTQAYKTYNVVVLKKNPYGIMIKTNPSVEYARNILKRQDFISSTSWYAVKGFHKKINTADKRILLANFATKIEA